MKDKNKKMCIHDKVNKEASFSLQKKFFFFYISNLHTVTVVITPDYF